jgi:hypothetical protein
MAKLLTELGSEIAHNALEGRDMQDAQESANE